MMTRNKLQGNFGAIISQSKDNIKYSNSTNNTCSTVRYHVCGDFNVLYTASISTLIFFYLCLHYHIGLFHYLKKYTVIVKPPPFKLKTPHSPQKDKISTITGFKSCPSNHQNTTALYPYFIMKKNLAKTNIFFVSSKISDVENNIFSLEYM